MSNTTESPDMTEERRQRERGDDLSSGLGQGTKGALHRLRSAERRVQAARLDLKLAEVEEWETIVANNRGYVHASERLTALVRDALEVAKHLPPEYEPDETQRLLLSLSTHLTRTRHRNTRANGSGDPEELG